MRRVRVGLFFQGVDQFYQREEEVRDTKTGRWIARPYFVISKREAITMSEEMGLSLVERLRGLKLNPFMEDVVGERRMDLPQQNVPDSGTDNRVDMIGTLDGTNSYVVRPANRPSGRCWFLRINVPGFPEPFVSYADDVLGVLQHAQDLYFLRFAERYEPPQPQQAAPVHNSNGWRRRPGDIWN
jgi:hypothetical protein